MSQTLVLLHGWGLNRAVWESITPQLRQQVVVHAINIPGFGGAPWDPAFTDINTLADAIATDINASCQLPVKLAGWSMGGLVAIVIALRHPQLVESLHTIASSPCFVAHQSTDWPGIEAEVLRNFSAQLTHDHTATVKRFLAVQAMGSPHARQDMKMLQSTVLHQAMADLRALAAGLQWLAKVDLRNRVAELAMPLHRLYGRLDSLVPMAIADLIAVGTSTVFNQSAHAPFLNQPDDFCSWLLSPTEKG